VVLEAVFGYGRVTVKAMKALCCHIWNTASGELKLRCTKLQVDLDEVGQNLQKAFADAFNLALNIGKDIKCFYKNGFLFDSILVFAA
jgi:hypothetical protein